MAEYIYFCTSLPFLHYGREVSIRSEQFLQSASTILQPADLQKLSDLDFSRASQRVNDRAFFREYYCWEVALRNQVMLQRMKVLGQRNAKPHSGAEGSIMLATAIEQILQQDPFAIEEGLDRLRWAKLNEICGAKLFGMMFLACYLLKLQLLERAALWQQKESGKEFYEKVSKDIVEDEKVGEI